MRKGFYVRYPHMPVLKEMLYGIRLANCRLKDANRNHLHPGDQHS